MENSCSTRVRSQKVLQRFSVHGSISFDTLVAYGAAEGG